MAAYFRSPLIIIATSILAAFTDERAIVALGGVFLIHRFRRVVFGSCSHNIKTEYFVVIAFIITLLLRFCTSHYLGFQTPVNEDKSISYRIIGQQMGSIVISFYSSLQLVWPIFIACLITIILDIKKFNWLMLVLIFISQIYVASIVGDTTRSMIYIAPTCMAALFFLKKSFGDRIARGICLALALVAPFMPLFYCNGSNIRLLVPSPVWEIIR